MKKRRGIGVVIGAVMIAIIIIGGVHKKIFNWSDNNEGVLKSSDVQIESSRETISERESEHENSQNKISLRNYDFEVVQAGYVQDEADYVEIELTITNHSGEEAVLSLNNISLKIEDLDGNEIRRIPLENVNNVDADKAGVDYFHYTVPGNGLSEVRLFFMVDMDVIKEGERIALHFNPFGTEDSVIFGKNEKGERVEITDTDNVADIYVDKLMKGNE